MRGGMAEGRGGCLAPTALWGYDGGMNEKYETLRRPWMPDELRLIIIAESPPKSGLYFYDPSGKPSEPLFSALIESIVKIPRPATKDDGLKAFRDAGCLLLDATYTPVDGMSPVERDRVITCDLESLCGQLDEVDPAKRVPILLVKVNVCKLLELPLVKRGHTVMNNGRAVEFPSTGNQGKFRTSVAEIFKSET